MKIEFRNVRDSLQEFDFKRVFVEELGWSNPPRKMAKATFDAKGVELTRAPIAELAGFIVFEVTAADGQIPDAKVRAEAHKIVGALHHEHVLVFVDGKPHAPREARNRSVWSWVHRKDGKEHTRTHYFFKGQPGDLFIGKLGAMLFDLEDFDVEGNVPIVEVANRVRAALDVETVTKKFFGAFQAQHVAFLELVKGIDDERDRRWYVSVLLNRLMFVYFLQKKGFIDQRFDYLAERLEWSRKELGRDQYFKGFLELLFFEGFAKPEEKRSSDAKKRLGKIPYLNGGLFLPHRIERANPDIDVPDEAFENLFALFQQYSWHLDDTPGGDDRTINPDVLGYIFEKYINQKSFGAYYTRPEITEWLCEETIHRRVLDRVNLPEGVELRFPDGSPARFADMSDLLLKLTPQLCRHLLDNVLPKLSILDPACGSGAFLVAALKTLRSLYGAVVGAVELSADEGLKEAVARWRRDHRSLDYFLKKQIITDNLYGVDIMEEATEIARLRLFLALVSSASTADELEPLPNIDFNILAGNSLIGLLKIDDQKWRQQSLFDKSYRQLVEEKNRKVRVYRHTNTYDDNLVAWREEIEAMKASARARLDEILREEFVQDLGIKFEQPTWDDKKNDVGKSQKRALRADDIHVLKPFHWGYEFDDVVQDRGGFDVILANPPWDVFKPSAKEFFQEYSDVIQKSNMRIEEFEKEQKRLLKKPDVKKAWLEYLARFPHVNDYFRSAEQYTHQSSVVAGKRTGTDINLYKLFVEQCLNLLRLEGQLGIVVPGSLYADMGAGKLREALLNENTLHALFGLSNERYIFEGVHHSFKVCLLVATKSGRTGRFTAAFRINPREAIDAAHLAEFLRDRREHVEMTPDLVRRTSPESLSVMEFKSAVDVAIVEKMLLHPLLGADIDGTWKLELCREFHMTDDSGLFRTASADGRLPLYEGKMIHQYDHRFSSPRYWVSESDAVGRLKSARVRRLRAAVEAAKSDLEIDGLSPTLDYQHFRFGFRDVARSSDERSMICAVLPRNVFAGNTLNLLRPVRDRIDDGKWSEVLALRPPEMLYVVGVLNSFVADWFLRQRISAHLNMFYVYQLPLPRLTEADPRLLPIASRAAKLTCTTAEFDDLAKAVGLGSHKKGVTDPEARAQLRAEIDALVAHLYGLAEDEFAHVLRTFPVVPEPVRIAARNAYRAVARGDVT